MKKPLVTVRINWKGVNTPSDYREVLEHLETMKRKVKARQKRELKKRNDEIKAQRIKDLKALEPGSEVHQSRIWLSGDIQKLNGATGKKVKDGKKYMIVDFEEAGKWKLTYDILQPGAHPDSKELVNTIAKVGKKVLL